jgi:exosome complex exonuclease RRP6
LRPGDMSTIDKVLLDADSNDAFIRGLMGAVVLSTKESNSVPQGSDFHYRAVTKEFREGAENAKRSTMDLMRGLCQFADPCCRISDDMEDSVLYDQVVDVIDSLLETADRLMGENKGSKVADNVAQSLALDRQRLVAQGSELPKPQLSFMHEIDNDRMTPFRPRVVEKYYAEVPLEKGTRRLELVDDEEQTVGPVEYYPHPYEHELRNMDHPSWCSDRNAVTTVNPSPTYSQLPFTLIETDVGFEAMLKHLAGKTELAVDLEHHSLHTFQGLTCVLQVCRRA